MHIHIETNDYDTLLKNKHAINQAFKKRHSMKMVKHEIQWGAHGLTIYCHWNSAHMDESIRDITQILNKLNLQYQITESY